MRQLPTFRLVDKEPSGGLQGETPPMTYSDIVNIFGEPQYTYSNDNDAYKVSTQWNIEFSDGTLASIYDYKMTSLYDAQLPSPTKFRRQKNCWHIGGDIDFQIGHVNSKASHLVLATICLNWSYTKIMDVIDDIDDHPNPMLEFGITTPITVEKMIAAARLAGKKISR